MQSLLHKFAVLGVRPLACLLLAMGTQYALASENEVDPEADAQESVELDEELPEDSLSGSLDDSSGSIEAARETLRDTLIKGWQAAGDMRAGYFTAERDQRDGSSESSSFFRGRFRLGGTYTITDAFLARARISSTCSSDECDPEFVFEPSIPNRASIDEGDITFDELYLHTFRLKRFAVAAGRLQTKFVARAGVFAKSLDRNDSHNTNVNWTDGLHATLHIDRHESIVHLIVEYNDEDGPSNVKRGPIDFTDDDSRVSYFLAWEDQERWGPFTQRGLDVTYLPSALLKDGTQTGAIEDYVGVVARAATSKPIGNRGWRWNVAGEIGYAPETPTRAALDLPGEGDADGFAWTIAASLMDIWPNHSIGFNYGRADAGWLLSPQYRDNEELAEIRYQWRKSQRFAVDVRVRRREELIRLENQPRKQDEVDLFARFTLGFSR